MELNSIKKFLLMASYLFICTSPIPETKIKEYTKNRYEYGINSSLKELKKINYVNDREKYPGLIDYWQTPKETDSLKTGDCEDKSIYLYSLLNKKGIKTSLAYGSLYKLNDEHKHIWLEYSIDGKDYAIECSKFEGIYEKTLASSKYGFNYILLYEKSYLDYLKKNKSNLEKKAKLKLRIKNLEKY